MNEEFVGLGEPGVTVFGLLSRFTFGKYKGCTVASVIDEDHGYILWVQDNISWVKFTDEVLQEVSNAVKRYPIAEYYDEEDVTW